MDPRTALEPAEWMSSGPGGIAADSAERVNLDESVSMAFLVVLESMSHCAHSPASRG
jgi:hypothetical protein